MLFLESAECCGDAASVLHGFFGFPGEFFGEVAGCDFAEGEFALVAGDEVGVGESAACPDDAFVHVGEGVPDAGESDGC